MKLRTFKDKSIKQHNKSTSSFLREEFNIVINNKVPECLTEATIAVHWVKLQDTWKNAYSEALGKKTREHKEWMAAGSWGKVKERKELKLKINQCQDTQQKEKLRTEYREANKQVKKVPGRTEDTLSMT